MVGRGEEEKAEAVGRPCAGACLGWCGVGFVSFEWPNVLNLRRVPRVGRGGKFKSGPCVWQVPSSWTGGGTCDKRSQCLCLAE
jgi:hypothetical protein